MRLLITGSRWWEDWEEVWHAIDYHAWDAGVQELTVVHGACPQGADQYASDYCESQAEFWEYAGRALIEDPFPAEWLRYGKASGPLRNKQMVDRGADLVLAFPLPGGSGTQHCMEYATKKGLRVVNLGRL